MRCLLFLLLLLCCTASARAQEAQTPYNKTLYLSRLIYGKVDEQTGKWEYRELPSDTFEVVVARGIIWTTDSSKSFYRLDVTTEQREFNEDGAPFTCYQAVDDERDPCRVCIKQREGNEWTIAIEYPGAVLLYLLRE